MPTNKQLDQEVHEPAPYRPDLEALDAQALARADALIAELRKAAE
jgi:hypothetical protein